MASIYSYIIYMGLISSVRNTVKLGGGGLSETFRCVIPTAYTSDPWRLLLSLAIINQTRFNIV